MTQKKTPTRLERDSTGEVEIPVDAYWGIGTSRYLKLLKVTETPCHESLVTALVMIKKSAATVNGELGLLERDIESAIAQSADELLNKTLGAQIVVDAFHAAAGIGLNTNINEVLANRANQILGFEVGTYERVHPLDHVNLNHGISDAYITAMRLSILLSLDSLTDALLELERVLRRKSLEFERIVKPGRIFLKDSSPVTLGQEMNAYGSAIEKSLRRIQDARDTFREVNLGGTYTGTGYNTTESFHQRIINTLARDSKIDLKPADDYFRVTSSMTDFASLSSNLKELAIDLVKVVNDLRILSSGPAAGMFELKGPRLLDNSDDTEYDLTSWSKEPPVPETLLMICHQVMGLDHTVSLSAQAGLLEGASSTPVIINSILDSISLLEKGITSFSKVYLSKVSANQKQCKELLEETGALVAMLSTEIGYEKAEEVAKMSRAKGVDVKDFLIENKILQEAVIDSLFGHRFMTSPKRIAPKKLNVNSPNDAV